MFRPSYDPDLFYHWHKVHTRFRDLDPLNHANNAVFNTYFEEARIGFTYSIPELVESLNNGFAFVLVKSTIEYLKPITYPSELLIGSGISELGNTSVIATQAIFDSKTKQLHSVAQVKGVWYDSKTRKPTRVPEVKNLDKILININE
ncbi:MAG: acyl-CoA thioesterase [Balneolaceae bacterium]|nr:acyl-CoA thioesterase [Balneolaceae bacterium]MBO6546533.1 acyl-CoA thioesterase [Balneolaceae bacterium]MBO6648892.1 acyl-CoA thioesterase [Balneolaceae bacterium]